MRTTALLILLVVFVCTGEALKCKKLGGGTEVCPPGNDGVCIHYKYKKEEFKRCGAHGECQEIESSFKPLETANTKFVCCSSDLCN
uniref:Plethodontid modulating factor n=1 Tax=Desmognathus ocoee TaxID=179530 RepID=Q0GAA8_9SALA|nr:plethodontid modulating factor [Desmognathus ocoee]ABI48857.1 plethodontid modulating factor [Desmognathus ocoee]ABI48858.1 plethodontid modulating factor [Desmognathus ocoee]